MIYKREDLAPGSLIEESDLRGMQNAGMMGVEKPRASPMERVNKALNDQDLAIENLKLLLAELLGEDCGQTREQAGRSGCFVPALHALPDEIGCNTADLEQIHKRLREYLL